jgi:hypothetical protein
MGPIPSDMGPPRYFQDLYIPSYTPSLSSLIESRKVGSQTSDKPSILLVLQPDTSTAEALGELQAVQGVRTRVKTFIGATATLTAVLECLQGHPFAHIVCHGIFQSGKPFDSSFGLHNGYAPFAARHRTIPTSQCRIRLLGSLPHGGADRREPGG